MGVNVGVGEGWRRCRGSSVGGGGSSVAVVDDPGGVAVGGGTGVALGGGAGVALGGGGDVGGGGVSVAKSASGAAETDPGSVSIEPTPMSRSTRQKATAPAPRS
jgi:hypothetical protein